MWLKSKSIIYLALVASMLTLFLTGFVLVSAGNSNDKIEAALDEGRINHEQAEAKRQGMKKRVAEGFKGVKDWNGSKHVSPEDIEAKIEAALDEGRINQEQAEAKRQGMKKRVAEGFKRAKDWHWK